MTTFHTRLAELDARLTAIDDARRARRTTPRDVQRAQLAGLDTALTELLALVTDADITRLEEAAADGDLCWGILGGVSWTQGGARPVLCPSSALTERGDRARSLTRTQLAAADRLMAAWDGAWRLSASGYAVGMPIPADHPLVRRLVSVAQAWRTAHPIPDHQTRML